jgi:hypothetical protein
MAFVEACGEILGLLGGGKLQVDASYIRVNKARSIGNFRFLPVFGGYLWG